MAIDRAELVPLQLAPTLHQTIWGGRSLAAVAAKRLPVDARVGESWETEVANHILNGPFTGKTLAQAVAHLGQQLLGSRAIEVFGQRFPLLAKFIDAQDKLSVQVHPNDAQATQFAAGKLGKTEAWYILRAEPGAQLVLGFEHPVNESQVRDAIARDRLEALLHTIEVRAGDVVFVPAGTVHAIGGGIVLYELQEYSDITFRLYDYGRVQRDGTRRELHVAEGLRVIDLNAIQREPARPIEVDGSDADSRRRILVACQCFVLEELRLNGSTARATFPTSCEILSILDGTCEMRARDTSMLFLGKGDTVVLPAQLGSYQLDADHVHVLRSYVPTETDAALVAWRVHQR